MGGGAIASSRYATVHNQVNPDPALKMDYEKYILKSRRLSKKHIAFAKHVVAANDA